MEGWFRWHAGNVPDARPHRIGRRGLDPRPRQRRHRCATGSAARRSTPARPIGQVRDGAWHHLVATKEGGERGALRRRRAGRTRAPAPARPAAALPWHVMRNGSNDVYTAGRGRRGRALLPRALAGRGESPLRHRAGSSPARPLPPETPDPDGSTRRRPIRAARHRRRRWRAHPHAAPTRRSPTRPPGQRASRSCAAAADRARGVRHRANRLTARRRGRAWRVADAAAPLRAGAGCRRLGPRAVSCRAARVKRIEMHGGAGADTLTVTGRIRALLVGGPGPDRLSGGRLARFRRGRGR